MRKALLPSVLTALLAGAILLPLVVPVTCGSRKPRVIPIEISSEAASDAQVIAVTVRYYASETGGEPVALEHFHQVPLGFGGYSIDLGSSSIATDGTVEWESSAGVANLAALLQAHRELWYTVALAGQREPAQRHRINPADLKHCAC